jgi:hypothetical protein
MLARYDALVALRDIPLTDKRQALLQSLSRENFHGIVAELASQLANDPDPLTISALSKVFSHLHPEPKLSLLNHAVSLQPWKSDVEQLLHDSSYDVVALSLTKLCRSWPENAQQYLGVAKDVEGMNMAVRIHWHELAASAGIDRQQNLDALAQYASQAWEFRTRNNAFAALKATNHLDAGVAASLFNAMLSTNGRLAGPASQLAEAFSAQSAYRQFLITQYHSAKFEDWQRELLKKQLNFLTD